MGTGGKPPKPPTKKDLAREELAGALKDFGAKMVEEGEKQRKHEKEMATQCRPS